MGILFAILKIMGIIIGSLITLAIFIILTILFLPIKYRVNGSIYNTMDTLSMQGSIWWIFHLIKLRFSYLNQKLEWSCKVAWISFPRPHKETKTMKAESEELPLEIDSKQVKTKKQAEEKKQAEQKKESKLKKSRKKKITILNKIRLIWSRLKAAMQQFYKNLMIFKEKKELFFEFIQHEVHQNAFQLCKNQLVYLLKKWKPKKFVLSGQIGFEDPSITGKVLAVLSVLYPLYGDTISVDPDFDQQTFNGKIELNGGIRIAPLVVILWKLWFNSDIQKTYKDFKKIK